MEPVKEEKKYSKQILSSPRGKYTIISEDNVDYHFDFPANSTLLKNYEIVSYLKDEITKALEIQAKKEQEKKRRK